MNTSYAFEHKVIEVKPKLFGNTLLADTSEALRREGQQGWELVSAVQNASTSPLLMFFKRRR